MRYSVFAENTMRGVYSKYDLLHALIEAEKIGGYVFDWYTWKTVRDLDAIAFLEKRRETLLAWVDHKKQQMRRRKRPKLRVVG